MANFNISPTGLLINNNRVFIPSSNINVFPCSRRGQLKDSENQVILQYDPEARLNTERTNRLHTAINGFTDSFIIDFKDNILKFVLAGYYVEVKNFDPIVIATALGSNEKLYAYLSLHENVSLNVKDYYTELLYRQSDIVANNKNYLDIQYSDGTKQDYFFVGVSFVASTAASDVSVTPYYLELFSKTAAGDWELTQTSMLPKVEHGETIDSIKLSGDLVIEHNGQESFKVTSDKTTLGPTEISTLTVSESASINQALNVNTINSRAQNGTVAIEAPAKVNGALEVTGDTAVKSSLSITDNINVGTPTTPATGNNSGYVVAKKDIIAEQDLVAKRDIKAFEKATVKSLVVGERTDADSVDSGAITAKTSIKTPLLNVTNHYNAQANIDNATITGELKVQNNGTAKITADAATLATATVTGTAELKGKTTVSNDLDVTGTVSTPTLKVNQITSANSEIIAEKPIKVDTINSDATKGLTISQAAKLDSTLTVGGNSTLKSNLKVEDNINVGNPAVPASADNGGCIVAQFDITAEEDVVAKRDISAGQNLTVGTDNNTNTGTITAKKLVSTPTINVDTITSKSTATDAKINVSKPLVANSLEVTNKTTLKGEVQIDKPTTVYNSLTISGTGNTLSTPTLKTNAITSDAAEITVNKPLKVTGTTTVATVDGTKITADEIWLDQATDVQVPALELVKITASNTYQLRFKFGTAITIKEE